MDLNDDENLGNVNKAIGRRRTMEDQCWVGYLRVWMGSLVI